MGVLKEDQVNIIVHGHEPNMFESMLVSVNEPRLFEGAKDAGAKGINLVGMCCSGAEMMSRHGIPHAGNFMSTEAVLVTGAVDAMCVDVQCIKQGLVAWPTATKHPLITTNPGPISKAPPISSLTSTTPECAPTKWWKGHQAL
jgi:carbon-monoxide dehydrogenase catalytic subunit